MYTFLLFLLHILCEVHAMCKMPMCNTCNMSNYEVIPVGGDVRLSYGFTPHWDKISGSWYAIDFLSAANKTFYRYDYAEQRLYRANFRNMTVLAVFMLPMRRSNYFAIGIAPTRRIPVISWCGRSDYVDFVHDETGVEQDQMYATNFVDLSAVDPCGQLVVGEYRFTGCRSTPDINANIYVIQKNGTIVKIIPNVKTTGGFAWNGKKKLMYFIDSCDYILREYDWDPKTGTVSQTYRTVYIFPATQTYVPLGMTISCKGNLFIALNEGSAIWEIDPRKGKVVRKIEMPVPTVNGLSFGGPNMDILFVTSTSSHFFNYFEDIPVGVPVANNTLAGSLFMITGLCAKGCNSRRIDNIL